VDIVDALAFYVWAIVAVALGMGVWGLATAMAARAVAGTAAMARLGPLGLVRPRWSWAAVRPLLGFGAKLQTISIVGIVRDQGINAVTAAIGGVATLGAWNLAFRVLQAPTLVFTTVGRISYPAMSRVLGAGRDPRSTIERGIATLTVATAFLLVAIAGFAPALPALIGEEWHAVPATLATACAAMIVGAPVYIMTVGYLYAADRAGAVLRAMVAYAAIWFAVTFPLLPALGAPAIGIGWIVSSVVSAVLLARPTTRETGASIGANLLPPAAVAALAGAAGWAVASVRGETVFAGLLGMTAAELVLLAGLALIRPSLLVDAWRVLGEAVRGATGGRS
jgi:O-antigen/teichoic acid export membrane protein